MKRLLAILFAPLALLMNACEKHPASELPTEHATEFGEHAVSHGGAGNREKKSAEEHAKSEASVQGSEAKPGEAPKFFPEKK